MEDSLSLQTSKTEFGRDKKIKIDQRSKACQAIQEYGKTSMMC
jgi:hypothetical protein